MAAILRPIALLLLAVFILLGLYSLFWPVPFTPRAWTPPPNLADQAGWPAVTVRADAERHLEGVGEGPEAIAAGPDGRLYTGMADGRIVSFDAQGSEIKTYADVGGRPLGLKFAGDGTLYIANADLGLQAVAPGGATTTLVDAIDGAPILFADDLAIGDDGAIWFSDASAVYPLETTMLSMWSSEASGRLIRYSPSNGQTEIVLDGLAFANGVALGPDNAYVLVAQTSAYRITRHWLKGPKAGTTDVFIDGLPGFIDNITWDAKRELFWVALPAPRAKDLDTLNSSPFMKKVVYRLLSLTGGSPVTEKVGWVLAIDPDGTVVRHLELTGTGDHEGPKEITSAIAVGDRLWVGSIYHEAIHSLPIN